MGLDRIDYRSYADLKSQLHDRVLRRELERAPAIRAQQEERHRPYDVHDHQAVRNSAIQVFSAAAPPMRHRFGRPVEDDAAIDGRSWEADLSGIKNHLVFGPYETLPRRGRYVVLFRIWSDHNNYAADPVLTLDVWGGATAARHIYAAEWHQPRSYRNFGVHFTYDSLNELEYRVYNMNSKGVVRVDSVAVLPLVGPRGNEQVLLKDPVAPTKRHRGSRVVQKSRPARRATARPRR